MFKCKSGQNNCLKTLRIGEVRITTSLDGDSESADGKWVYVFRDRGWGIALEWEFEVKDGRFHKVDLRNGVSGDHRSTSSSSDYIMLKRLDEHPVAVCVSSIQLPVARIRQYTGKGQDKRMRVLHRCNRIVGTDGEIDGDRVTEITPSNEGDPTAYRVRIDDYFAMAKTYQDAYLRELTGYMHANMMHQQFVNTKVRRERYKQLFLANLAKGTAEAYKEETDDYPYGDDFEEARLHREAREFVSINNDLQSQAEKLKARGSKKDRQALLKFHVMASRGYVETREDYMFDVDGEEHKLVALRNEANLLKGSMYTRRGRTYLERQLFEGSRNAWDTESWYYRHFLKVLDEPSAKLYYLDDQACKDDESAVAIIVAHIGMALASRVASRAGAFFRHAMSQWVGKEIPEERPFDVNHYVGGQGFPELAEHEAFTKQYANTGLSGADAVVKLSMQYSSYADEVGRDWPLKFVGAGKYPMLGALGLIQFNVAVRQGDVFGTVAAGSSAVALLVEASSVPAAIAAGGEASIGVASLFAVGTIAVVLAAFTGFAIGLVKMFQALASGDGGEALGWAIISAGAAIGAVVSIGAWSAAAGTATAVGWTGWGLLAAVLVLIGTSIVLWFTDDDFEEWFEQSPWAEKPSHDSADEQLHGLLKLIGQPKMRSEVRVHRGPPRELVVELTAQPLFFIRGQTELDVSITLTWSGPGTLIPLRPHRVKLNAQTSKVTGGNPTKLVRAITDYPGATALLERSGTRDDEVDIYFGVRDCKAEVKYLSSVDELKYEYDYI